MRLESTSPYAALIISLTALVVLLVAIEAGAPASYQGPERATTTQLAAVSAPSSGTPSEQAVVITESRTIVSTSSTTSAPLAGAGDARHKPAQAAQSPARNPNEIRRIDSPYATAAIPFDTVNTTARAALVNIVCMPNSGSIKPISGSGVIIDPRGVILTNAHVAQYVLLSQSTRLDLSCTVRTGAPATARWVPNVLYIPSSWVEAHADEIEVMQPKGTGEHDYALLYISGSVDGQPRPDRFPFLSPDTREAIAFVGDPVLVAAYPAEFLGGTIALSNLYPGSSITSVREMQTFGVGTVDAISLGGVIQAQSGSSGGAAVNAWGRLVGVLTTTSDGATTAERDLRAVTLSYIDRDLRAETGTGLAGFLDRDPETATIEFARGPASHLINLLLAQILDRRSQ